MAINESVTSCDVSSIPLDDGSLDVAVFSLSLMGKNWNDYIKEAYRCLATNGFVFISETTNALNGRLSSLKENLKETRFEIYDEFEMVILHLLKHENYDINKFQKNTS